MLLPSPMTVTWLPVASTGATASTPVWLPAPVPSARGVSDASPAAPAPELPCVGVVVTDDGHLVAGGVHRCGRARIRLVARTGAVLRRRWCHQRRSQPRGPRVGGGVDAVVARLHVGHLAVTDDGHLVARGVHRSVGLGVGLVARTVGRRTRRGVPGGAVAASPVVAGAGAVVGVAVSDHGDLVVGSVHRCGRAGVGLVARSVAALTGGAVGTGATQVPLAPALGRCRRTCCRRR